MPQVRPEWPLFIVPHHYQKKRSQLARIAPDGQIHRLRPRLPFPFTRHGRRNPHAASAKWIVGLLPFDPQAPVMRLFRARLWANGQRLERLPDIELSPALEVHSVLLDGDWLYLGGGVNNWAYQNMAERQMPVGEYFSRLRLSDEHPALTAIPLPVAFGPGKAIDDLQRNAYGQLLAVDNVIMPKYLFFYQLQGHEEPRYVKTHKLPFTRVNETYKRASWNEQFVALLSRSVGMGGSGQYISVLRRSDLKPVWLAGIYNPHRFEFEQMCKPAPRINDVVVGDQIVFAAGLGGVGCARLSTAPWPKRRVSGMVFNWYQPVRESEEDSWQRYRETQLVPELNLLTAGPAQGVTWLPAGPNQPSSVETVRLAHPNVLLLTGRNNPGDLEVCWTQPLL